MAKTCTRSPDKIRSLHQICREQLQNEHQVVLLCGAGVTMSEYGKDASWAALLGNGVQFAKYNGAAPDTVAEMEAILARVDATPDEWLQVGHQLTQTLKALHVWELWLRDAVEDCFTLAEGTLLKALGQCGQLARVRFATTNYDFLLERANGWQHGQAGLPGFCWQDKNKALEWQRGKLREVYHLHGHVRAKDSIVLGTASYDALNADKWIAQLRSAMSVSDTVIFIGCGATLQDPAFRKILETGFQQVQAINGDRRWYQLVSNDECVGNPWITALPYGADFTALPDFIQTRLLPWLAMKPEGAGSNPPPVIQLQPDSAIVPDPVAQSDDGNSLSVLARLEQDFADALQETTAQHFRAGLCKALNLPISTDVAHDALSIRRKLDGLESLEDQLLSVQEALQAETFASGGGIHPVERAATALYMRAAIRFVNLQAAAALRTPVAGLTVVPEKSEVVIAILMAALEGEIHTLVLKDDAAKDGMARARGGNMIDLDGFAHDPLQDDLALEIEARKRVNTAFRPERVDGKQMTPQQREDFRDALKADLAQKRKLEKSCFRFIVSGQTSGFLYDDVTCSQMFQNLGIPVTRVGLDQPMAVKALLGVSAGSIEAYFQQFLRQLQQAKQGLFTQQAIPANPTNREPSVSQTVNIYNSTIGGSVNTAKIIADSFNNLADSTASPDLNQALNQLLQEIQHLQQVATTEQAPQVAKAAKAMARVVDDSSDAKTDPSWYQVSWPGLCDALGKLSDFGGKALELAGKVQPLLAG